jgi:hypothetical protein
MNQANPPNIPTKIDNTPSNNNKMSKETTKPKELLWQVKAGMTTGSRKQTHTGLLTTRGE